MAVGRLCPDPPKRPSLLNNQEPDKDQDQVDRLQSRAIHIDLFHVTPPTKKASLLGGSLVSYIRAAYAETLPAAHRSLMTRSWTRRTRIMTAEKRLIF